jgi:hypothetical protein
LQLAVGGARRARGGAPPRLHGAEEKMSK